MTYQRPQVLQQIPWTITVAADGCWGMHLLSRCGKHDRCHQQVEVQNSSEACELMPFLMMRRSSCSKNA